MPAASSNAFTPFAKSALSLLGAGLSIQDMLHALDAEPPSKACVPIIKVAIDRIQRGKRLSDALGSFPATPPVLVASLRAAEQSGAIVDALRRFVAYAERQEALRSRLRKALVYPAIVVALAALVFGFILLFLVPRLSDVYQSLSKELPLFSRLLFGWGGLVSRHPLAAAGAAAGLIGVMVGAIAIPQARQALWLAASQRGPLAGFGRDVALARLYRDLATLAAGGLPLHQSLELVRTSAAGPAQAALTAACAGLRQGRSARQVLAAAGLTTPSSAALLSVGEQAGDLPGAFGRIADLLESRIEQRLDVALRLLEPAIAIVMSVGVGGLLLLMYMPIFEVTGGLF